MAGVDVSGITGSLDITGLRELDQTFKKLPAKTQDKAMKPALRAGAVIIRKAAVTNVKGITADSERSKGTLAKSLTVYQIKKRGFIRFAVMVKKGMMVQPFNKPIRVGAYAGVLEYGKEGQPPQSWIRRAARDNVNSVLQKVAEVSEKRMGEAIEAAKKS